MSPMKKTSKPLAVYTRVSQQGKRSDSELLSHDLQEKRIRDYAKAVGLVLAPGRIEDTDMSGGKMKREGLDRVLEGIRAGTYGGIVVARLTRFARSLEGGIFTIRQISKTGGAFVAVDSPFDTTTAQGRAMLQVSLVFAELELATVREYSAEMRHKKIVEEGAYISGRPPAGYDKKVTGKRENGKPIYGGLKPNRHAKAVLEAFELRAKGGSWREIAALLTARKVPTTSGKPWSLRAASKLIANRAYVGEIRNGGVRMVDEDGDVYETPVIINPKAHKALVSESLFRRANRQREERSPADPSRAPALLSGLLVCGTCEHNLVRDFVSRKNAAGKTVRTPFYRCRNDGACSASASITHTRVEPFVVDAVLDHVGTIHGTSPLGENPEADEAAAAVALAEAALAEVKAARAEFKTTLAWGLALDQAQADLEAAYVAEAIDTRDTYQWYVPGPGDRDYVEGGEHTTKAVFGRMPVETQREALRSVVERIVVKKGSGPVEKRCKIEFKT